MGLQSISISDEDIENAVKGSDWFVGLAWVGTRKVERVSSRESRLLRTWQVVRGDPFRRFLLAYRDNDTFGETIYALDLNAVIYTVNRLNVYLRHPRTFTDLDVAIMECAMICNMNLPAQP